MKVIDVSKHNGSIDWKKVKAAGVDGVIIRAGYGRYISQKDKPFDEYYEGAVKAGLHVGSYWYSYAESAAEAEMEAKVFQEAIKGKKFDLPVYFDIEEPKQVKLGKTVCTAMVEAFCMAMERAGYFCGVYSFDSFFGTNLEIPRIQDRYSCWVARIGSSPQFCTKYGIWQHSWTGRIDGISGDVDVNECYKDFVTTITNAGLNGYSKTSDTYTVKASISGVPPETADKVSSGCKELGMTVKKEKE